MGARGGGEGSFSQHSTDRLIRELIRTDREAAPDEIARIVERMATAPFFRPTAPVLPQHRGASYRRQVLGARSDALLYHLTKRVVIEKQWIIGATERSYLNDLRGAVLDPAARLAVYDRRGGPIAATVTPTVNVVPLHRLGSGVESLLLVIYAVDRGMIITGYQISTLAEASIPPEARWLK
jgi:hypothetical protein